MINLDNLYFDAKTNEYSKKSCDKIAKIVDCLDDIERLTEKVGDDYRYCDNDKNIEQSIRVLYHKLMSLGELARTYSGEGIHLHESEV